MVILHVPPVVILYVLPVVILSVPIVILPFPLSFWACPEVPLSLEVPQRAKRRISLFISPGSTPREYGMKSTSVETDATFWYTVRFQTVFQ